MPVKRIAVDWDGTLVEAKWPDMGEWMPGAIAFLTDMLDCGVDVIIFTARMNSTWPDGSTRPWTSVFEDREAIRRMLDDKGFAAISIFEGEKPSVDYFVDDRSLWYPGTKGAWRAMTVKVLARFGIMDPS